MHKSVKPLYKLAVKARESFSVRVSLLVMPLQKKKDRALRVKLFYQNDSNHLAALREYRRLKDLRKGLLSRIDLRKMIMGNLKKLGIWVCCPEEDGNQLGLKLWKMSLMLWLKEPSVTSILQQVINQ
ncbi:hypothetical protein TNCV_4241791 [Trichonephila clavipes]|nr:hypothetical protein TNCV_4241791 [Trichonephila clavipes]